MVIKRLAAAAACAAMSAVAIGLGGTSAHAADCVGVSHANGVDADTSVCTPVDVPITGSAGLTGGGLLGSTTLGLG
ncbi:hypothetical protein ACIQUM_37545 [Amycolatopsis azurea]|uniref:hypothetical protein n=1 Tax=Amycolatopsis azurea TaxID=36819 RepID=UPI0037FDBDC8